jgi:diacylglycerol kinase family enzyme
MLNIRYLIANPVAGSGRVARLLRPVMARLRERGCEPRLWLTDGAGDACRYAERIPRGADAGVFGGDGTLIEVINGLRGSDCRLLLLPGSSGNDLARGLHIPIDPLEQLASPHWNERTIDLGEIGCRLFANNAGVGLDGEVCRLIENCDWAFQGRLGYVRATVSCVLNQRATAIRVECNDTIRELEALMCTFANGGF